MEIFSSEFTNHIRFVSFFLARNPQTWVKPAAGKVLYNYKATNPHELSIYTGQLIQLAPKEVQQTHKLLHTGWALATIDNKTSGLVPINYVSRLAPAQYANPEDPQETVPETPIVDIADFLDAPVEPKINEQDDQIQSKMPFDTNDVVIDESAYIDPQIPADIMKDL